MDSRIATATIACTLLFTGAGCISISGGGGTSGADGGVFRSDDFGEEWTQKVAVPQTGGREASINQVSVTTIVQDPSDDQAIYIGTVEHGIYYSYDAGESWRQPPQVNRGRVPSIAVDPADKCRLYVAAENKLLRSEDCARTFTVVYEDARADKAVSSVVVDAFNSDIVWMGNSGGDVYRSVNRGEAWTKNNTFDGAVARLAFTPEDSRRIYAATEARGLWRTDDAGESWIALRDNYRDFSGAWEFSDLAMSPAEPGLVVLASKYGLLRSHDHGATWETVPLLTPPNTTMIYSVAVDPTDAGVIYYGTASIFYKTKNGGAEWVTNRLPSERVASDLLIDRNRPSVLYLGVTSPK
jgi:photosystem II stability/assembly factor-like uncharacterized protein